jgi:uncharacterized SAM-binding protein YcdF (DUF218 family)
LQEVFFILSKLLAFLVSPLTWIFLLLAMALFSRDALRRRNWLIAALATLYLFCNSFLFDELMRAWEVPVTQAADLDSTYAAAIVLSGMLEYDVINERTQFNRRNDRLMQAVLLYRQGKVKKLFFSGGSGSLIHRSKKESEVIHPFLVSMGIPASDILLETSSDNTYQNASFSRPLLQKYFPDGHFLLVTSAFHERRALACFRKQGLDVTPYSTDRYSGPRKFIFDHLLIPDAETLFDWDTLTHEWVGYVVYRVMGYI